jgi:hypothetical protein
MYKPDNALSIKQAIRVAGFEILISLPLKSVTFMFFTEFASWETVCLQAVWIRKLAKIKRKIIALDAFIYLG